MASRGPTFEPSFDEEAQVNTAAATTNANNRYKGKHPIAGFFHVIFKLIAIMFYVFSGMMGISDTLSQTIIVLLLAADFWTVKNITGRVMVGLRWWNAVSEDGENVWYFEALPDLTTIDAFDSVFFWGVLVANIGAWIGVIFISLTSFQWWPILALGIALGGANLVGYIKCRKDAGSLASAFVLRHVASAAQRNPDLVVRAGQAAFQAAPAATMKVAAAGASRAAAAGATDAYGFTPPSASASYD